MTTIFDDSSKEMACRELLKNGIHQAHVKYMANDLFVTFCLKRCFSLPFNLHSPIHQYLIDEIYNAIRGEPSNSRSITFSMAHGRTNSEKVQFIYSTLIKLFTINNGCTKHIGLDNSKQQQTNKMHSSNLELPAFKFNSTTSNDG